MNSLKTQQGVGMIEVLVALLLLAIGVLGFTALQLRAVDATNEALYRVQAMSIARDLAEKIRINPYALTVFKKDGTVISADNDVPAYVQAMVDANASSAAVASWSGCYGTATCTSANMAIEDVRQVINKASQQGMKINLMNCQSSNTTTDSTTNVSTTTTANLNSSRKCIYVAWDKTNATDGDATTDCAQYGIYKDGSKCIILEAY